MSKKTLHQLAVEQGMAAQASAVPKPRGWAFEFLAGLSCVSDRGGQARVIKPSVTIPHDEKPGVEWADNWVQFTYLGELHRVPYGAIRSVREVELP